MSHSAAPADHTNLFAIRTLPMRAFHCAWVSFFPCCFGLVALMATIREDPGLTVAPRPALAVMPSPVREPELAVAVP